MTPAKNKKFKKQYPAGRHVGIFVNDIDKTSRFYIQRLGFKMDRDYVADQKIIKDIFGIHSSCRIRYLSLDDFGVELFYFPQVKLKPRNARTSGANHWTLLVRDKFSFCRGLKKKNVKVIEVIKSHTTTFFIEDPEANLIEVKSHEDPNHAQKRY